MRPTQPGGRLSRSRVGLFDSLVVCLLPACFHSDGQEERPPAEPHGPPRDREAEREGEGGTGVRVHQTYLEGKTCAVVIH